MSAVVISDAKIRARVVSILKTLGRHHEPLRPIGIIAPGPYQGSGDVAVDGRTFHVRQCDTVLAFREALLTPDDQLVLVTRIDERELGYDVLGRLARARLHTLQPWPILLELFQANDVAPKLGSAKGVAEYLLDHVPSDNYKPAPLGKIDEELVWGLILGDLVFSMVRPDLRAILEWSSDASRVATYRAFSSDLRASLQDWVSATAGSEGRLLFGMIDQGHAADLLPLGLVIDVAQRSAGNEAAALRVRLETFTKGQALTKSQAEAWREATVAVVTARLKGAGRTAAIEAIKRADVLLGELSSTSLASVSDFSRVGLDQRFVRFANALTSALGGDGSMLADAIHRIEQHRLAQSFDPNWNITDRDRAERAQMAARLARWLSTAEPHASSIATAAADFARNGGWVDWARQELSDGDHLPALSAAYQHLLQLVVERREKENVRFATLLAQATQSGSLGEAIGVEDILAKVVAPVVRDGSRVLLLVMDGMSQPVFHQLVREIQQLGWYTLESDKWQWPRPILSALPSITEVSRASLFSGKLVQGKAEREKNEFAVNPALLEVSSSGAPPVLFHKAALNETGSAELAADVRDALQNEKRKVVGVVVNAIDDFLLKGAQMVLPRTLGLIPILGKLLFEAEQSRRVVILTSDHGHVIDRGTSYRAADAGGERYRSSGSAEAGEVRLAGARVAVPKNTIVAAATEGLRYTSAKKFGYHGGATPQECVVPLAVLGRGAFGSWTEAAPRMPSWWTTDVAEVQIAPTKAPALMASATSVASWIERLFASEVYSAQLEIAGRTAPDEKVLRRLLSLLDERKGVAMVPLVAQQLNVPEFRVNSIVAAARRVLNVESYPVIALDDVTKSVTLNLELLKAQFELED